MGALEGRVVVITGAGRGLGRSHALAVAAEGARVLVNDVGVDGDGGAGDGTPVASLVVDEIRAAGGVAEADVNDVADWAGAEAVIAAAIEHFGDVDVVVNNAGFLRDRAIVTMTEDDWDGVIRVHLKGHFAMTHWAAVHWRQAHKDGVRRQRSLIHTASTSGLFANPGQSNYGAAKSGIATLSQIASQELSRYGVVSNCILPGARTRLTLASPGLSEIMAPAAGGFDEWDPANVSPLVVQLASESCTVNGETFSISGRMLQRMHPWTTGELVESNGPWTLEGVSAALERIRSSG
ncbi:MAG: SDR family NAD(P)-dependent oxidoreductase [Ilumatobacteraceae bacterium]|jgi:NAD(P)-dependent dehydrogenase (short-subunit alcohol dehydrogenase family)